jgi:hypothetical protein
MSEKLYGLQDVQLEVSPLTRELCLVWRSNDGRILKALRPIWWEARRGVVEHMIANGQPDVDVWLANGELYRVTIQLIDSIGKGKQP